MKNPRTEHYGEHQDLSGGDAVEPGEPSESFQGDAEPKKRRIVVIDDRCPRLVADYGPAH